MSKELEAKIKDLQKQVTALKVLLDVERGFNKQSAQQEPVAWMVDVDFRAEESCVRRTTSD